MKVKVEVVNVDGHKLRNGLREAIEIIRRLDETFNRDFLKFVEVEYQKIGQGELRIKTPLLNSVDVEALVKIFGNFRMRAEDDYIVLYDFQKLPRLEV